MSLDRRKGPDCVSGIGAIADQIDHVILDQWGVLHAGTRVFDAALVAIDNLRHDGKRVIVLSNSGKRAGDNAHRLARMGLAASRYDGIVTSGELTRKALEAREAPPFDGLGRRCYLVSRDHDRSVVEGLSFELVDGPDTADFILIAGIDDERASPEGWRDMLNAAVARRLPMICANPDTTMISNGRLLPGPGATAQLYQSLGGDVFYIGKPHGAVFAHCLHLLRDPPAPRVLIVGDSLSHDILGGNRAGLATMFIAGGVEAPAFDRAATPEAIVQVVRKLADTPDKLPRWAAKALAW